jgi:hypothetical protein
VLRHGWALHRGHHSIVSSIASPLLLIRKPVPRPGSLIGGPGALYSVANANAAIALVALTVVNAGRPSLGGWSSACRACGRETASVPAARPRHNALGEPSTTRFEKRDTKISLSETGLRKPTFVAGFRTPRLSAYLRNAAISRRFERDPIPYALETDCPLEVSVPCERVSLSAC